MSTVPTIFVIDPNSADRQLAAEVAGRTGLQVRTFESAGAFLEAYHGERACLVLELRLPDGTGPQLQRRLSDSGAQTPAVTVAAVADVGASVQAMKLGAVDVMLKPVDPDALLERLREAIDRETRQHARANRERQVKTRLAQLTPREREVLDLIVTGYPNKQIAIRLGVTEKTVEVHRARVMTKMSARGVADLVRMVVALHVDTESELPPAAPEIDPLCPE